LLPLLNTLAYLGWVAFGSELMFNHTDQVNSMPPVWLFDRKTTGDDEFAGSCKMSRGMFPPNKPFTKYGCLEGDIKYTIIAESVFSKNINTINNNIRNPNLATMLFEFRNSALAFMAVFEEKSLNELLTLLTVFWTLATPFATPADILLPVVEGSVAMLYI